MRTVRQEGATTAGNVNNSTRSIGTEFMKLGMIAKTVFTGAIVMGVRRAVNEFAEFEASLIKITTLVGVAKDEVDGFRSGIMRLSSATGRGPKELADAMFFVTSAGLRGAEAMQVLEMSAKASAVGLGETKTVADLLTSAINAYGIEVLSASKATDILVATVREGKAEAPALAASMGQVLPVASEMGVTFDQVGAAIAAMTRTGTDAATASTQLRQILVSLLNPASEARDAMAQMGTSAEELRQQIREKGLVSVLGFLREQMKTNEEAMSSVFGNVRALSGALDIMGANAEENIGIFGRLANTSNELEDAFTGTADSVKFSQEQLNAEFEKTKVVVGEQLVPTMINLNDTLTTMLRLINDNASAIGWFAEQFGRFDFVGKFVKETLQARQAVKSLGEELESLLKSDFSAQSPEELDKTLAEIDTKRKEIGSLSVGLGFSGQDLNSFKELEDSIDSVVGLLYEAIRANSQMGSSGADSVDEFNKSSEKVVASVGYLKSQIEELEKKIQDSFDKEEIAGYKDEIYVLQRAIADLMGELKPDTRPEEPIVDLDQALKDVDATMESILSSKEDYMHRLFPQGSIKDIQAEIDILRENLDLATDPERQAELNQRIRELREEIERITGLGLAEEFDTAEEAGKYFSRTLADGLEQVLFRARSVEHAIKGILRQLASKALITFLELAFTGGLKDIDGIKGFAKAMFGGNRQGGGGVSAGNAYVVGEAGPELFLPDRGGAIISNTQLGGGDRNINIWVRGELKGNGQELRATIQEAIRVNERLQ